MWAVPIIGSPCIVANAPLLSLTAGGRDLVVQKDGYLAAATLGAVLDGSLFECVERVVTTTADIVTRVDACTTLTNDDRSSVDDLTIEHLGSQTLCL